LERASTAKLTPVAVVTDPAATDPVVQEELAPAVWQRTEQSANNHSNATTAG